MNEHSVLPGRNPVSAAPDPLGVEMGPPNRQTLRICRAIQKATVAFALVMAILMLYAWITSS